MHLDKITLTLDIQLDLALELIAQSCEKLDRDGSGCEAAAEARKLAQELRGCIFHPTLDGAQIVAKACDALRANQQHDKAKRMNHLVRLIKQSDNRRVVGSFLSGASFHKALADAGKDGAKFVGMEDPTSKNIVPIANIRAGL